MSKLTPQPARRLVRAFEKFGFTLSPRRSGDHLAMRKPGCARPLIFPDVRDVPVFVILNNLRSAGISRQDFLQALTDL